MVLESSPSGDGGIDAQVCLLRRAMDVFKACWATPDARLESCLDGLISADMRDSTAADWTSESSDAPASAGYPVPSAAAACQPLQLRSAMDFSSNRTRGLPAKSWIKIRGF